MSALLAMVCAAGAAGCLWPGRPSRRLAAVAAASALGHRRSDQAARLRLVRPVGQPRRRQGAVAAAGDVPIALDLVAVCLAAGATPAAALAVVGRALPGPLGSDLASVARALGLGSCARQAWAPVLAGRPPSLQRAADRFVHAERSGAALAPSLAALAADQRRVVRLARARAARRVGVLATAPLGLCFLPAFILTGVLPVIVGLVARLSLS